MRYWRELATAGVVVLVGAGAFAAPPQSGGQPGTNTRQDPAVRPRIEQRFEIPVAPWGGSSTARRLGVTLRELNPRETKERKLPTHSGVLVESVVPKSAAEKAGIKAGDVILEINGEFARSIPQVRRLVNETPEGQAASVSLFRDGKKVDASVTPEPGSPTLDYLGADELRRGLEERLRPSQPQQFYFWSEPAPGQGNRQRRPGISGLEERWPLFEWSPGAGRLGAVVQALEPQLADYFGVKEGVLVASVSADTPASRAGLKAGDVITGLNGMDVKSPDDLVRMIRDVPDGQEASFTVMRDRKPLTLKAKLASPRPVWHV
jgi:serine protease Do